MKTRKKRTWKKLIDNSLGLGTKNAYEAWMENEKEIFAVAENQKKGRITADLRAAESVWLESLYNAILRFQGRGHVHRRERG